jgi:hypothetical protein
MFEKTSKFIKSIYEDEDVELNKLDYENEITKLFNMFSIGKELRINDNDVKIFFSRFNKMKHIINNFERPSMVEYFNKTLGYLIIIDFAISFFRTENNNFEIRNATKELLFELFVKLGEFYCFLNYLDVDIKFLNYIKDTIVIFAIRLDRLTFERNFKLSINLLDEYFINEIVFKLFNHYSAFDIVDLKKKLDEFKNNNEIMKRYDQNIDYLSYNNIPNVSIFSIPRHSENPLITFKAYQMSFKNYNNKLNEFKNDIKSLCIGINKYNNDYDFDFEHTTYLNIEFLVKIKTILGIKLNSNEESNSTDDDMWEVIYEIVCEYGNFEVFKDIFNSVHKHDICSNDALISCALTSPNREISAYLIRNSNVNEITNELKGFQEPKVMFNYVNY